MWKDIKINGVKSIEKCVGEFRVWEFEKTPYSTFKVKIFENKKGQYSGYTNLMVKYKDGLYQGKGDGTTVEKALENTINNFMKVVNTIENTTEYDFECVEYFEF